MQNFPIAAAEKQRPSHTLWVNSTNPSTQPKQILTWILELSGAAAALLQGPEGLVAEQGLIGEKQASELISPLPGSTYRNPDQAISGSMSIALGDAHSLLLFPGPSLPITCSPALKAIIIQSLQEAVRKNQTDNGQGLDIDLLPIATALLKADGTMVKANPAFAAQLGYEASLLKGANLLNFIPSGRKIPQSLRKKEHLEAQLVNGVKEMIRAGGSEFPVFQRVFKLPDSGEGTPLYVLQLINMTDIHTETTLLKKTIKEQQSVLFDTDHRLKSNLQLVCSLLDLEARTFEDPWIRSLFEKSRLRVTAISLLNKHLFHLENNKALVRYDPYIKALARMVQSVKGSQNKNAQLSINTGNTVMLSQKVLYSGLIMHELVANAFDHGFPGSFEGKIQINSHLDKKKNLFRFEVFDNGVGLPAEVNPEAASSTGFKLIRILLRQLKAKMTYRYDNGALFIVEFNLSKTETKQSKITI